MKQNTVELLTIVVVFVTIVLLGGQVFKELTTVKPNVEKLLQGVK